MLATCILPLLLFAASGLKHSADVVHESHLTDAELDELLIDQAVGLELPSRRVTSHLPQNPPLHRMSALDVGRRDVPRFDPKKSKLMWFTTHKSGTLLATNFMWDAHNLLRVYSDWFDRNATGGFEGIGCARAPLSVYATITPQEYKNIMRECPHFRAVHFIREAAAMTVSGYIYHKRNTDCIKSEGIGNLSTNPTNLGAVTLEEGVAMESMAEAYTLREMTEVHKLARGNPNYLAIGLEEFDKDFDGTTRKMFRHLFGPNFPRIEELVTKVRRNDVHRWAEDAKKQTDHVASKAAASDARNAFLKLAALGEEHTNHILSFDNILGYEPPSNK